MCFSLVIRSESWDDILTKVRGSEASRMRIRGVMLRQPSRKRWSRCDTYKRTHQTRVVDSLQEVRQELKRTGCKRVVGLPEWATDNVPPAAQNGSVERVSPGLRDDCLKFSDQKSSMVSPQHQPLDDLGEDSKRTAIRRAGRRAESANVILMTENVGFGPGIPAYPVSVHPEDCVQSGQHNHFEPLFVPQGPHSLELELTWTNPLEWRRLDGN